MKLVHEAAVAVSAVVFVSGLEFGHGGGIVGRLFDRTAVEAGPVNLQHFGKVPYPTRLDLD